MPAPVFRAPLATAVLSAVAFAIAPAEASYVGKWHSFTDKSRVTALIGHQGAVYAGTQGGILRIDPATLAQRESGPTEGLIDPWITGLAHDGSGRLWAAARSGLLYRLAGDRWETFGRSYAAQQWQMNPRAILAAGNFLYVGTTRGLGVFDTRAMVSEVNVTRFQDKTDLSVLSLLRRGDTLYVGTTEGVFRMRTDFEDPRSPAPGFDNLRDHTRWEPVALPPDTARRYDYMIFLGDSLATFEPGTILPGIEPGIDVRMLESQPPQIGAQLYDDWGGFTSAAYVGGKVFFGGEHPGLFVSPDPRSTTRNATHIAPPRFHPREAIANIGAYNGQVWGHAGSGLYRFNPGANAFDATAQPGGEGPALYARNLRNVKVGANGDVYVGTWGNGIYRWRNGTGTNWKADPPSCLLQAFPGDSWTVVSALSAPRGNNLFFAVFKTEGSATHQLAHLNTSLNTVTCLDNDANGGYPHAVLALDDTLVAVATDVGINLVTVEERPTGPAFVRSGMWTLSGTANEAWDLAFDGSGRLWSLVGDQLVYFDSIPQSTTRQLKAVDNFTGSGCKSLEGDPQGALWIGCDNGLFHVVTAPDASILSVQPYRANDGLPGTVVHDLALDPVTGHLWAATDRGVAMFETAAQPSRLRGQLSAITPYPNPYRGDHRARGVPVVFRDVPPDATLRIHDASGTVVRVFEPARRRGNQFQWDGTNNAGRVVRPGVYLFSVTAGGKTERGKVIVAP